jgi:FAD/FMN-containing dehydrogenase
MDWKELQSLISGEVVSRTAPDFISVRESMVWNNIKPHRSPDLIVKVKNEADVVHSIKFAQKNNLKVVVHGGGHTWCGLAVRNGGMTIDLSELNESRIDAPSRKAIIQPVVSNRELARLLGEQGLAFPIGHCPTVKAGGYLLNGGMSWNMSQWGPACFNVEAIEFITANGEKVLANENEYSDLFWAGRGCGPGMFAVATRFHLKCYELPKAMMSSNYYYSLDDLAPVIKEVVELGWHMPEFVELSVFLIQAPPELIEKCTRHHGMLCMITAVAFANNKEEAIAALNILEKIKTAPLLKSTHQPTNFESLADASGATWPEGHRNLGENQCSKENPVKFIMELRDKIIEAPSPKSVIVFCLSTGQRQLLQPRPDAALSMDGSSYGGIWTIWEKAEDDALNYRWHRECVNILTQFTSEHYIGETDIVDDSSRVQKSYSSDKWIRLEQIRQKYDPTGLFFGFLGGVHPEVN